MTRIKLRYVNEYRDRYGNVWRYVRRLGHPSTRLPGLPGSPEFMAAYEVAISRADPTPKTRYAPGTLNAVALDYFTRSAEFQNLKPSSQRHYRKVLEPVLAKDGHRLARDMPPEAARAIIEEIGARRPAMANLTRSALRVLLRYAIATGARTLPNPLDGAPVYRTGTHHTWTDAELAKFEKRWPVGTKERLIFDLLLWTGQRVGDVAQIRKSDIVRGVLRLTQQKTGTAIVIPIRPELAASIRACPSDGEHLVCDRNALPLDGSRLSKAVSVAIDQAGLPTRCVAHGLRKAAMRRLAEHGASTKEMAAVSGHKSLKEIERYSEAANVEKLARKGMGRLKKRG